jgi:phenylpropionate dioxygenase-like ring-hydroxylating dioxygenase large terminal subunit
MDAPLPAGWYAVTPAKALGRKPVAVTFAGERLAVFRSTTGVAAVVDRCPHRNAPLSMGRVTPAGELECGYHGWCFDGAGRCTRVPGLGAVAEAGAANRAVAARPAVEQDGFVWVWSHAEVAPEGRPRPIAVVDGPGSGQVVFSYDLECSLHAALENALDVPHTAFLHRGIFRGGEPREITAVRRGIDEGTGVEVQYLGEPVGLGRLRGAQGSELLFDHWDRFRLPATAEIEYVVPGWLRIVNTILHLPVAADRTRAWFVVRYWSRFPARIVKPIVLARGRQILRQDAKVLARQNETIRHHGGEQFTSTELDLMGNAIRRLLVSGAGEVAERTVTLQV